MGRCAECPDSGQNQAWEIKEVQRLPGLQLQPHCGAGPVGMQLYPMGGYHHHPCPSAASGGFAPLSLRFRVDASGSKHWCLPFSCAKTGNRDVPGVFSFPQTSKRGENSLNLEGVQDGCPKNGKHYTLFFLYQK